MSEIWALTLVGAKRDPFLEPALRSVSWVDHHVVINTAPDDGYGQQNERVVRNVVPREKLHLSRVWMNPINFAKARNVGLDSVPEGDYVLIVDSDEVYYPAWEAEARRLIAHGHDAITSHYYHLAVRKDLLHSIRYREILFTKTPETRFTNGVHELLAHPRRNPALARVYHDVHYSYIRPALEVARTWELYRSLGATIHDYDVTQPDKALDAWPAICQPFYAEHPPAVRELLKSYPASPKAPSNLPCRVGLVLLTWNDAENLRKCLASLATTREPFGLCVVDNGSTDESLSLVREYRDAHNPHVHILGQDVDYLSLARALNWGFGFWIDADPSLDYIGWIHPDMTFEHADWLGELREAMDAHPEYAKLGAEETQLVGHPLRAGNSQCFIIRKTALEHVGLFDEAFRGIGGREDWDMNKRLLEVGKVMIWPGAIVRHIGMATRSRRDTNDDARANAEYYAQKWGTDEQPV